MPRIDAVERAVRASFPEARWEKARALLARYEYRESLRVKLAILVLAEGTLKELKRLIEIANGDYRDPLFWAEYPQVAGTGTKREMAARYRRLGVTVPKDLRPRPKRRAVT